MQSPPSPAESESRQAGAPPEPVHLQYVSVTVADHLFGLSVLDMKDVLAAPRITRIPLAPPVIAGCLNLRGRIVTVIDLRRRLGLMAREPDGTEMCVMIDHRGEEHQRHSLLVDAVGEIVDVPANGQGHSQNALDPRWRRFASGIRQIDRELLIILDVARLLEFTVGSDS